MTVLSWILVAVGGAVGSALGVFLLRRPSPRRLLISTAALCSLMGALSAYPQSKTVTPLVGYGLLGSAASMIVVGITPQHWVSAGDTLRSTLAVTKRLAMFCAVSVTFAMFGYLAVRAGTTLYIKLR